MSVKIVATGTPEAGSSSVAIAVAKVSEAKITSA